MKLILSSLLIAMFSINTLLYAKTLSEEEIKSWQKIGVEKIWINYWQEQGVKTPIEAKKWLDIGEDRYSVSRWKNLDIQTPEEVKQWKDLRVELNDVKKFRNYGITLEELKLWNNSDISSREMLNYYWHNIKNLDDAKAWKQLFQKNSFVYREDRSPSYYIKKGFTLKTLQEWSNLNVRLDDIEKFMQIGINTPEEATLWTDNKIYTPDNIKYAKDELNINDPKILKAWYDAGIEGLEIKEWHKIGIIEPQIAQDWNNTVKDVGYAGMLIKNGANNLDEVKKLKEKGFSFSDIGLVKRENIPVSTIEEWQKNDVKKIEDIVYLIKGGFDSPKKYLPYKNIINTEHAVKLNKWGIKPNKLVESMSYTNKIFGQELYFMDKESFILAYEKLDGKCEEIDKIKFFTDIDMSENNNKCFIFIGKMLQRLDDKSIFGKITQKGLVSDITNRVFYTESFQGTWLENTNKVGVIKGNKSFSYESDNGTKVVPKGDVIFFK
ncbi:hypothetical protein N5915_07690 [Arcobacter lacus]|uniref:hypothetical protein n=1 Tax=Arcobacter lacus TaxID=1912876 RepID=UPI0021BB67B0|nr:hypothetical protein [Arcobacter lacus]MCT7909441.1 hypothetical protein [Arcobacter lacus]